MNKNIIYIAIAVVVGLLGGWLIFGGSSEESMTDKHDHSTEAEGQMWTCSMHPQIMQPEPGDCPICGMDLIPAESGADGLAMNEIKMTKNAMALANIQTSIVRTASIEDENIISLSGKIKMNEEENAVQASYFDGRIERLNVNFEGQEVRKGQLLATIYAPSLIAAQQELITAASLKESQPSLYNAVRNKLKLWKLSESQINSIEESGKVKENFPIYATVSGTVSDKMAAEGDYVKQGQPIVKVSNLNSVWAEFDAYENQISDFKKGQKIEVTTNAYPNKEFDAIISFIAPMLNTQTRTVTVRANLKNSSGLLKPGMFVTGKVEGKTANIKSHLTIPASAVMWTGERSLVYIKTNPNEPVFEMREVTLSNRNGDVFTVTSGLKNGDEIVTNGTFSVDAAAQLQGKKSMMNQSAEENKKMMAMELSLSTSFQEQFVKALPSYLELKDALVASDAEKVSAFAKATSEKMKAITQTNLDKMLKSHLSKSIEMLDAIASNSDLENQRSHFVILNENLVAIVMNLEGLDDTLYVQKCPMANDNEGAVWLSLEEEIRNPYYGDAMLTCGSVIDSLPYH
ncbi:efflux RND transporter periplasmic adaptor subunit [Flagellimonas aequoris]|uniref:Efflux RND transporter periplasmic adaptor subunit n=1 Tax=Flagellimonas aequoris TaxID=2306997 RepID=A0A418NBP8_9FLAO|nr:efflux RND transporter periplasmic adaptor subunit [Allomuricauda aequoris]RIV74298.1 efflux RND transporter periplasmic adaptor subunit [Allomuricauda aequoris]TXK08422.1 efflux RND transporter periplasmic adaptor subunit [Allomuricauda aequoris]